LPFAERTQFGGGISLEQITYAPGRRFHSLRVGDIRVGAFICFEAMYPELVRNFVRQGADILANPSNDDWFGHAAPARLMLDMVTVRAIENRRYLVRPTTTGFSAIIDPHGRAVALSGFGTPEILTASVRPSRVESPYQRWGDATSWITLTFVTAVSLYHGTWSQRT
jgi:apolipoprotein N-acyltransferase